MSIDDLLTVADVAEHLSLNQQTVRNMIDRGDLVAYRVGRRVRVRRADLEEFVTRSQVTPREESAKVRVRSAEEITIRDRLGDASCAVMRATADASDERLIKALTDLVGSADSLIACLQASQAEREAGDDVGNANLLDPPSTRSS